MNLSDTDRKQIRSIMEYGVFLDIIVLMIDFCLHNKKMNIIYAIRDIYTKFISSLSESEKKEFSQLYQHTIDSKVQNLGHELHDKFSTDELQNIIPDLTKMFTQTA